MDDRLFGGRTICEPQPAGRAMAQGYTCITGPRCSFPVLLRPLMSCCRQTSTVCFLSDTSTVQSSPVTLRWHLSDLRDGARLTLRNGIPPCSYLAATGQWTRPCTMPFLARVSPARLLLCAMCKRSSSIRCYPHPMSHCCHCRCIWLLDLSSHLPRRRWNVE